MADPDAAMERLADALGEAIGIASALLEDSYAPGMPEYREYQADLRRLEEVLRSARGGDPAAGGAPELRPQGPGEAE